MLTGPADDRWIDFQGELGRSRGAVRVSTAAAEELRVQSVAAVGTGGNTDRPGKGDGGPLRRDLPLDALHEVRDSRAVEVVEETLPGLESLEKVEELRRDLDDRPVVPTRVGRRDQRRVREGLSEPRLEFRGEQGTLAARRRDARADQLVQRVVPSGFRKRRSRYGAAEKQETQESDRVAQVDVSAVIDVHGVETGSWAPAEEEIGEDVDGIGDVDDLTAVRVAPDEVFRNAGRKIRRGREQSESQNKRVSRATRLFSRVTSRRRAHWGEAAVASPRRRGGFAKARVLDSYEPQASSLG